MRGVDNDNAHGWLEFQKLVIYFDNGIDDWSALLVASQQSLYTI
jgi:hypothetical protein